MKILGTILLVLGFGFLLSFAIMGLCWRISYNMKCEQYLKRSADANTVVLAKQNLDNAIQYLERNQLTNGIVSIFLRQPKNDIGYWYLNLKSASSELSKVTDQTTQLERSNLLMKLRETLLDTSETGAEITCPSGISIYPYNALFFWIYMVAIIFIFTGAIILLLHYA